MKRLILAFLALFLPSVHAVLPKLVELETQPIVDVKVIRDDTASRGAFVTPSADGVSLAYLPMPEENVSAIWARHRGTPVVLKNPADKELGWIASNTGETWEWSRLGTFTREETGAQVEIFVPFADKRKGDDILLSGVDAIVFALPDMDGEAVAALGKPGPAESFSVPDADVVLEATESTESDSGSLVVPIEIDWSQKERSVSGREFGLNIFQGYDPDVASTSRYSENLAYMAPQVLRYHNGSGMPSHATKYGWMDDTLRAWDSKRMAAALDGVPLQNYEIVMCISGWPQWMDGDNNGLLDRENYDLFIKLCADLVRILNIEQKRNIKYFEITNEKDITYWLRPMKRGEAGHVGDLAEIYNRCAVAMKQVDPTIKTGGPAASTGALLHPLKKFATLTKPNLDFFSYHTYASGDPKEPDARVYNKVESLGRTITRVKTMLDEVSPDRRIELHLNEHNICYTHKHRDLRMGNHKGAVFDALVFIQMVQSGLDVGNAWNECDNTYGKMNRNFILRPAAHVFHYFNTSMIGTSVRTTSENPNRIVSFAVEKNGAQNWVLINRSANPNTAKVRFAGQVAAADIPVKSVQISEAGLVKRDTTIGQLGEGVELPPDSVTFYFSGEQNSK